MLERGIPAAADCRRLKGRKVKVVINAAVACNLPATSYHKNTYTDKLLATQVLKAKGK